MEPPAWYSTLLFLAISSNLETERQDGVRKRERKKESERDPHHSVYKQQAFGINLQEYLQKLAYMVKDRLYNPFADRSTHCKQTHIIISILSSKHYILGKKKKVSFFFCTRSPLISVTVRLFYPSNIDGSWLQNIVHSAIAINTFCLP